MNKFRLYFILPVLALLVFSCKDKGDDLPDPEIVRDFSVQYLEDIKNIETYLKTHYIESVVDNPGFNDDQDVNILAIPSNNTTAVPLFDDPRLEFRDVEEHLITYRVYYIKLREGNPDEKPSRVDAVLPSYRGSFLSGAGDGAVAATQFTYIPFAQSYLPFSSVIRGWVEVLTQFGTGTADATPSPDPAAYDNFGAGVMFIPSGLAYYNSPPLGAGIPKYVPLMFTFKLYAIQRLDQDGDGIPSYLEDTNHNGIFTDDDTDGDGIFDYLDTDDDGDGYLTRMETKKPEGAPYTGDSKYYPYDPIISSDPTKNETAGVPDCSGNTTSSTRLRKYLDPTCH